MIFRPPLSNISQIFLSSLLLCGASLLAQTPSFITFDAPDAGTGTNQGTFPTCMNDKGVIAGTYTDSALHSHGFVRDTTGAISEFTPPGVTSTVVADINNRGEIVGNGYTNTQQSGYLRTASGRLTRISVPGSVQTFPSGINEGEEITGGYFDAHGNHGFIRDSTGVYTTFDVPGAKPGKTYGGAINNNGTVIGTYIDQSTGKERAYLRDQFANFTTFDVPGGSYGVSVVAINLFGEITGWNSTDCCTFRGFLRDSSGTIAAIIISGLNTFPVAINDSGLLLGQYGNDSFSTSGFVRDASGTVTTFKVPLGDHGTFPTNMNNTGRISGHYVDAIDVAHGFVR